jgi:NAD(P)-dependent dehydrogenase (short-subunit alcohol dehydrogenase family)
MAGKTVLINGAAGALGREVVQAVAGAGHNVLAVDRSPLPEDLARLERVQAVQGDALSPDVMAGAVRQATDRFGGLDGLFHLAGTYRYASLADTDLDLWQMLLNVNLTSAYVAAHAVLPALTGSGGVMVFVGAQAGISAPGNQSAYVAGKAGVIAMARSLAAELRPAGVRVNVIVPDIIDTPANRAALPKADPAKWLQPQQVADVLLYLLSDAASGITGAAINLQRS